MSAPRRGNTGTYKPPRAPGRDVVEEHRILIPQPITREDAPVHRVPRPLDAAGNRIQITAYLDLEMQIVERWQFSDEDVRWYRIEKREREPITQRVQQAQRDGRNSSPSHPSSQSPKNRATGSPASGKPQESGALFDAPTG